MSMSNDPNAREMAPAPRLPDTVETPAHLQLDRLPATVAARPTTDSAPTTTPLKARKSRAIERVANPSALKTPGARVMARAAANHRQFLSVVGKSQQDYMSLMSSITGRAPSPPGATAVPGQARSPLPSPPSPQTVGDAALQGAVLEGDAALRTWMTVEGDELFIELSKAPFLIDHRPDYGKAVVPMMSAAEIFGASAQSAFPGKKIARISGLSLRRWIIADDAPLRIRRAVTPIEEGRVSVKLYIWREAARAELSRDEEIASGEVWLTDAYSAPPPAPPPIANLPVSPDPYEIANVFHGPEFQLLSNLQAGPHGASGIVDAGGTSAPIGVLHPILLDAALHAGADRLWAEWCPGAEAPNGCCLPLKIDHLSFYGPTPTSGRLRVEMRPDGLEGGSRFPTLQFYVIDNDRVWMHIRLVFVATGFGPLDHIPATKRRDYLLHRKYFSDVHLSRIEGEEFVLTNTILAGANWIPGTVETSYRIPSSADVLLLAAQKEFAAKTLQAHPGEIDIDGDTARCARRPGQKVKMTTQRAGSEVRISFE